MKHAILLLFLRSVLAAVAEHTRRRVSVLILNIFDLRTLASSRKYFGTGITYLPRHVTLTEQFFRLFQVNLDLLYKEREERLRALAEGILAPGEVMSVKAARQRFFDEKVAQALKVRRERAIEQKRLSRIARSTQLDDRQFQIAAWLINTRPEVSGMTPDDFELLVYHYLRQIKLNFDAESPG